MLRSIESMAFYWFGNLSARFEVAGEERRYEGEFFSCFAVREEGYVPDRSLSIAATASTVVVTISTDLQVRAEEPKRATQGASGQSQKRANERVIGQAGSSHRSTPHPRDSMHIRAPATTA
jgi:hypothetical protein